MVAIPTARRRAGARSAPTLARLQARPRARGLAQTLAQTLARTFGLTLAVTLAAPVATPVQAAETEARTAPVAERHMVAAANPLAVEAGLEMLDKGGTAVDAAIAVQMVLGLVEPQSSGIGGGGFLLHYDPEADAMVAYDGRETAPAGLDPQLFLDADGKPLGYMAAALGGAAVGVPGNVAMLAMAHDRHGALPWADLFEPAIRLARDGFEVSPRLHKVIGGWLRYGGEAAGELDRIGPARDYFFTTEGEPIPEGLLLKNPAYARTLSRIAQQGPAGFYDGPVAEAMVDAVQNAVIRPGALSLDDLAGYEPVAREPVCGAYRATRICSMGPPSSGATTVLAILGLLDGFDMAGAGVQTAEAVHLFAEASRLAYADRGRYLADPAFADVPVAGLIDPGYLAERRALIDPDQAMAAETVVPGTPPSKQSLRWGDDISPELPATSHMTVVDDAGRVVSFTTTVQIAFGSMLMAEGFLLNNELTDFSFRLEDEAGRPIANRPEPGKRPRSSMSPVIAFDDAGRFDFAVGSPGGGSIINYVAKAIVGLVDWDLTMQQAVALPNMVDRGRGLVLDPVLEPLVPRLEAMGHDGVTVRAQTSGLHGIRAIRDDAGQVEHYQGGADPRREGVARGR
ncbi:gamma-glutamyltransferase [Rhodothalassium salexigens]|uniref:gamma-glutamyltransferase n=1 Tax=Rhodothalassium salexigens TaxID=1086 RepID=UPI0019132E16|nr:gamma-glutamyltransferase [Rhodothalassium salexigens]MBK5911377.1 gamma-glutamyltransferase [Rhodothalassium salexigens]